MNTKYTGATDEKREKVIDEGRLRQIFSGPRVMTSGTSCYSSLAPTFLWNTILWTTLFQVIQLRDAVQTLTEGLQKQH